MSGQHVDKVQEQRQIPAYEKSFCFPVLSGISESFPLFRVARRTAINDIHVHYKVGAGATLTALFTRNGTVAVSTGVDMNGAPGGRSAEFLKAAGVPRNNIMEAGDILWMTFSSDPSSSNLEGIMVTVRLTEFVK